MNDRDITSRTEEGTMHIHLIGPGGAGKTTIGRVLAPLLGYEFYDLDEYFIECTGKIFQYIEDSGHEEYAKQNVLNYYVLKKSIPENVVIALSSGFMTYPPEIHPEYAKTRDDIENSPNTFVLLPGLDMESCVRETVRRQMLRPYLDGNRGAEEEKIRKRFPMYNSLGCRKVSSAPSVGEVAEFIMKIIEAGGKNLLLPSKE